MVSVQFRENFTGPSFCCVKAEKFQTFTSSYFDSGLQKIVLSSLLLFSCICYWVDLDDIQWNEVAISSARSFNNSWPLYLNFFKYDKRCPNIWFIKNSRCQQFLFWKKSHQKTQTFHLFKRPLFRKRWPYSHEC